MQLRRLAILICIAAACRLAAAPAALAASHAPARPAPRATHPLAVPAPAPTASAGCDKQMTFGEVTLCSNEFNYNFKTGDVQFPQPLHGQTSDGTYRADRGFGNLHGQIMDLVGHVVVHRNATRDRNGKPIEALTLTADRTHIESKAKFYRASGNVKIVQGNMTMTAPLVVDDESHHKITASGGVKIVRSDQTLTAPQIVLDESTHVADLSGGVHAEQKPDRSFDAAEVFYNTQTQDFKAVGSVRLQFPANQPPRVPASPSPSPATHGGKVTPAPSASVTPGASKAAATAAPAPSATPAATPAPGVSPSA